MKNRFLLLLIVIIVISEKRMGVFIMKELGKVVLLGDIMSTKLIVSISFPAFAKWRML